MKTVGTVAAAWKLTLAGMATKPAWLHLTCEPRLPLACPNTAWPALISLLVVRAALHELVPCATVRECTRMTKKTMRHVKEEEKAKIVLLDAVGEKLIVVQSFPLAFTDLRARWGWVALRRGEGTG